MREEKMRKKYTTNRGESNKKKLQITNKQQKENRL